MVKNDRQCRRRSAALPQEQHETQKRRRRRHPQTRRDDETEDERITMPVELVLHIASFVNTRKLYLILLSLNRELLKKGKAKNDHPLFDWPRISLTSKGENHEEAEASSVSLAFSSDSKYLLQTWTDDSEGLKLQIWDNVFGPGSEISVEPFWKSISNRQVRALAKDLDKVPSAYHGTLSNDGRYLVVVHEVNEESSTSPYYFSRVFCLVNDAGNAPPKFDRSNYVDVRFPDEYGLDWKRSSFSPSKKYVLIEFCHVAFVWNIHTQDCVQAITGDDNPHRSPICCADGYTVWQEGHNFVLSEHGTSHRWTYFREDNHNLQHSFEPHPTDPSILASTTASTVFENERNDVDGEEEVVFDEEATLDLWKAIVQGNNDPAMEGTVSLQRCRSLNSTSVIPATNWVGVLRNSLNRMRWNNDGSQLLFNRFNRLCVVPWSPAAADPTLLSMMPGSNDDIYTQLVQSANATMDSLFDWCRHYIKDFQMSPDCKALIVHIGDNLPPQKDKIFLFPLHSSDP